MGSRRNILQTSQSALRLVSEAPQGIFDITMDQEPLSYSYIIFTFCNEVDALKRVKRVVKYLKCREVLEVGKFQGETLRSLVGS